MIHTLKPAPLPRHPPHHHRPGNQDQVDSEHEPPRFSLHQHHTICDHKADEDEERDRDAGGDFGEADHSFCFFFVRLMVRLRTKSYSDKK